MVNKCILIGNLGSDPDLKFTTNGTAVATLSVATNRRWKDSNGQMQDETEWHRVIVWAKTAEYCGEYLKKGAKVYIGGRISTRKWADQNGNDRYTTEIIAQTVQNLSGKSEGDDDAPPVPGDDPPF